MEKREVESKKKRDPCGRRERDFIAQKKSVASNVKLPIMESVASKRNGGSTLDELMNRMIQFSF